MDHLPNFYFEMKWDVDSSVMPLVGMFAPSDTFKIWKYKNQLRVDFTLIGYKNLKSKRSNISILFNPTNL